MADLAIDVVKATTQFVGAQAWEEIKLARGFQGHLKNLKERFNDTQAFLNDVGSANGVMKNQRVERWIQKVKDVAYFADNVMDDYDYEILRRDIELGKNLKRMKKVCNFFTLSNNPVVFRFRMTHNVIEILSKFNELDKEANKIGLKQVDLYENVSGSTSNVERTILENIRKNASVSDVIGREKDKQKLLKMMCSPDCDNEHLFTIVVVGLGGLGKTTLVRAVYNEQEKVGKQFEEKMWVCVSEDFNVKRILKEMVELLSSNKCDLTNMESIVKELQAKLKGKKFLLILDDVWKEDKTLWESLKEQLKRIEGRQGSVILVTTRSKLVAASAGVGDPYELKGLSEEDSWSLFENRTSIPSLSYGNVGKRIVEKCKGVPLAITTVGGLLQSKKSIHDWESIERNEVWATSSSEGDPNYILPSLLLSYHHLPSFSFKQCFAFCATFPKDHIMDKNELIDLWIAQGFLKAAETTKSTLTMEDKGEECFKILLNISFLQLEEDDWWSTNTTRDIWKCKMHDLVHDLAIHIFQKELFIWNVKADTSTAFNFRHLVLFDFEEDKSKTLKGEKIQHVRTLNVWSGNFQGFNVLTQAKYLRSLMMVNNGITQVPPMIEKLKHLRYLDMSSNPIEVLPDSICKLYQLQALILLETTLRELPRELRKLVSLRRLEISGCVCQHLPINDLGKLPNLRVLCLYDFFEVECIGENENNHVNESIETTKKGNYNDGTCLENEFFPVLRELRIRNFDSLEMLNMLPRANAITFPCLEVLEIVECPWLKDVKTSPALNFKSLKSLYLEYIDESEEPLDIIKYQNSDSSSLTSLIVKDMRNMKSLPQTLSNCSRLETLHLDVCPKLVGLPSGLSSLVSLKHMKLMDCEELVSLPDDMFHNNNNVSSLSSLCELIIWACPKLVCLPDDMFKGLSSLRILNISECERLEKIPTSVTECTSLETLIIRECESVKDPLPDLSKLQGLVELAITATSSMFEWIPKLPRLQNLRVGLVEHEIENEIESRKKNNSSSGRCVSYLTLLLCNGNNDDIINDTVTPPLHVNLSLKNLWLEDRSKNKKQKSSSSSLLEQLLQLHLPNLQSLTLEGFEELERLPESWISTLSSLQKLCLWSCNKLSQLPAKKHLSQLKKVIIIGCPILKERIIISAKHDSDSESEWHNISHVPNIEIDRKSIKDLTK